MKNLPLVNRLYVLFYLGVALSLPIQVAYLFGHSFTTSAGLIFSKLTVFNYFVIILCILCAYLTYKQKSDLKLIVPLTVLTVGINNYFVASYGEDFSFFATTISTLLFAIICELPLFYGIVKTVAKRSKCFHKIKLVGDKRIYNLFDISETGAFIETRAKVFRPGDMITFHSLKLGRVKAKVIRVTKAKGKYPQGVGIKFD